MCALIGIQAAERSARARQRREIPAGPCEPISLFDTPSLNATQRKKGQLFRRGASRFGKWRVLRVSTLRINRMISLLSGLGTTID